MKYFLLIILTIFPLTEIMAGDCLDFEKIIQMEVKEINVSPHAALRQSEGRAVNKAREDVMKASRADMFIQDDGRIIIRRAKQNRTQVFEPNGELVTTVENQTRKAHQNKVMRQERRAASNDEYEDIIKLFRGIINAI